MSVGSQIRRIAVLNVPVEAMREMFIVLAEQLEQEETRRKIDSSRTARYRERLGIGQTEWQQLRIQVLIRDDHTCQYCGENAGTVDHVIPPAAGGDSHSDNLVAACDKCNSSKRDRPVSEWEANR